MFDSKYELIEEKSSFITLIKLDLKEIPDMKELSKELSKEYKKARHICWAYKVTIDGVENKRYSDDGEPKGTAGIPILSTIEQKELDNILVVVVRYFGGKKLGSSKLLRTYRRAAKEGIENINEDK